MHRFCLEEHHVVSQPRTITLGVRPYLWRRWILAAILCAFAGSPPAGAATVNGDLKIFVLNVGQGDALLLVCPHGTHQLALMGSDHTIEVVIYTTPVPVDDEDGSEK